MKYIGIIILIWGSCMLVFALANIIFILIAGAFPSGGAFVRFAVGLGIAAVGGVLYDLGKTKG